MAGGNMSVRIMRWFKMVRTVTLMTVLVWTASSVAQEAANRREPPSAVSSPATLSDSVRELREQVRELQAAVAGMRSDWQQARAETAELRRELDAGSRRNRREHCGGEGRGGEVGDQ